MAARQYQVDEKNVRRWRQNQAVLKEQRRDQRAARLCSPKFPELEKEFTQWIEEKHKGGITVLTTLIRLKARSLAKEKKINESDFKASVHWCHHFMNRNNRSIRLRMSIVQKLPENLEHELQKFQSYSTAQK